MTSGFFFSAGQLVVAAMMFIPTLGVLLSGAGLKDRGRKLQIRKSIRTVLIAWFAPVILTAIGAGAYSLIIPGQHNICTPHQYVNGAWGKHGCFPPFLGFHFQ